jgi:DHA1 family bicyclomycin/chloramphenicol resistance-like MFS transporter
LLSSSLLPLAVGSSVLTGIGWLAWRWYQVRLRELPPPPSPRDVELQAQIAEPR